MKVYVLFVDDHHTNPEISGVYSTEEKARKAFMEILLKYWPKNQPDLTDEDGSTFEECVKNMGFAGWGDYLHVEEHKVA